MGASFSRERDMKEKEEQKEVRKETDKRFKEIKDKVSLQKPLITENVIEQLRMEEDTIIMRYGELEDRNKIAHDIKETFKNKNAVEFLTEVAENITAAVFQSSNEMTGMQRWNQVKKVTKCGEATVVMELHYKVVITEEKVGALSYVGRGKTDTVVILGYKFIQHALNIDSDCFPDDEKLKALRF